MTLPPIIRIFFAIDLPEHVKTQVSQLIGMLKRKAKTHGIRWTRPENLHVTLQFLAEVKVADLEKLLTLVRAELRGIFESGVVTLGKLQLFPNPYRPRVIVLEVTPQEKLAQLAALIGNGIQACAYPLEKRPYRAHLTLGRIKYAQNTDLTFLSEVELPSIETITLQEVTLFRSEPQPEGSKYTVLEAIPLS